MKIKHSLVIYSQAASYVGAQVPFSALENHARVFVVVVLARVEAENNIVKKMYSKLYR